MVTRAQPHGKTYYPAFDGLRGLGMLLVLIAHARLIYLMEMTPSHGWENWLLQIADFNWIAMEWFFAMSGFLITGILLDTKSTSHFFRNFYARRFLRIFPLYYGFLAIYFFVAPRVMNLSANAESVYSLVSQHQGWYWTYMANVFTATQGKWLGEMSHLWSLSVEEHFYIVWPLLVYFLSRRALMVASTLGIVASTALRAYFISRGIAPISLYVMTITRVDSILMGSMLAVLVAGRKDRSPLVRLRKPLSALAVVFMPILVWFYINEGHFAAVGEAMHAQPQGHLYPPVVVFGYVMVGIMSCALLVWLLTGDERNWLVRLFNNRLFRMIGAYSYGIYIIHLAVFGAFHQSRFSMVSLSNALGSRILGLFAGFMLPLLVTVGLAWAIWHGYEKQFLKLKQYFEADSAPAPAKAPAPDALIAPMASTSTSTGG